MTAEEADFVRLYAQVPPIVKLDNALSTLKNCEYEVVSFRCFLHQFDRRLALSTNNIDRMGSFGGMPKLKILSLGRNLIKKVRFYVLGTFY